MPSPEGSHSAQETVALLRRALPRAVDASPAALEECAQALEQAHAHLLRARGEGMPGLPPEAIQELRREIGRLAAILEQAATFHQGWVRLRNALTAGYSCHGAPAEFCPQPRLKLEA